MVRNERFSEKLTRWRRRSFPGERQSVEGGRALRVTEVHTLCRPFQALCRCLLRSPFCCCCLLLFVKRLVGARFHGRRALGSGHHRHWGPAVRADAVRDLPLVGAGLHGGGDSHGPGRRRNERFACVGLVAAGD
jgi:hypothetical protein